MYDSASVPLVCFPFFVFCFSFYRYPDQNRIRQCALCFVSLELTKAFLYLVSFCSCCQVLPLHIDFDVYSGGVLKQQLHQRCFLKQQRQRQQQQLTCHQRIDKQAEESHTKLEFSSGYSISNYYCNSSSFL